jgi:hypothetical protein
MTRQERALRIAEESFAKIHGPRETWSRADQEAHDALLARVKAAAEASTSTREVRR